jgi:hypothetical protein
MRSFKPGLTPELYKNRIPKPKIAKIDPKTDTQTIRPTKHLRMSIYATETMIEKATPTNNHCQFYDIYDFVHFLHLEQMLQIVHSQGL